MNDELDIKNTITMLRIQAVEYFPGEPGGKVHFIRAVMESAAESMEAYIKQQPKGQSKRASVVEVLLNYTIGFVIAWITSILALKALGISATVSENFWITVIFTIVSICRSYLVRRLFNHLHARGILR